MNTFTTANLQTGIIFGMTGCLVLSMRKARQYKTKLIDALERVDELIEMNDEMIQVLCDVKFEEIVNNYDE